MGLAPGTRVAAPRGCRHSVPGCCRCSARCACNVGHLLLGGAAAGSGCAPTGGHGCCCVQVDGGGCGSVLCCGGPPPPVGRQSGLLCPSPASAHEACGGSCDSTARLAGGPSAAAGSGSSCRGAYHPEACPGCVGTSTGGGMACTGPRCCPCHRPGGANLRRPQASCAGGGSDSCSAELSGGCCTGGTGGGPPRPGAPAATAIAAATPPHPLPAVLRARLCTGGCLWRPPTTAAAAPIRRCAPPCGSRQPG